MNAHVMSTVYLNDEYLPVEDARVSVLDRGFTFGDAVYEVIPVYGDHVFRQSEHLQRLDNSLAAIGIKNPRSSAEWDEIFSTLLERSSSAGDRSLYIQVTRGVSERDHLQDIGLTPTVFAMCRPARSPDVSRGMSAITHDDIRWKYCHIKATTLLANVLLKQAAREKGAAEAILVRDGSITEGAASNVFIVEGNTVLTPVKDSSVLPGITRDLVLELLEYIAAPFIEKAISPGALKKADEVWLTSSSMGIMPVVRVDGTDIGQGAPGEIWKNVNRVFEEFKKDPDLLNGVRLSMGV